MKSTFNLAHQDKFNLTVHQCLQKTGIYQGRNKDEYLVVVQESPHARHFGIYDVGHVFPFDVDSETDMRRVGDVELIVNLIPNQ